jgi:diguanylate cyclase (GGDEF)-like protein
MEAKLCGGAVDGFYTDALLLDSKLLRHSSLCSGLAPHIFPVPDAKLFFGTMSTKAARAINDRLVREIGEFAVDGTLERTAAKWGVFTPYDPTRLKQVADAERRQTQMAWALGVALLVLSVSVIQTKAIYRAKRNVERAQAEAKDLQSRFDQFMRHTPAITFIKDERKRLVYSNEQFCCNWAPEGGGREARNGGNTAGSISGLLCDRDDDVIETGVGVEVTEMLRGSDGRERHFLVAKFPFRGDGGARFLGGVALDVTDRVLAEKELEYQASRDPLTGLPNRRSFMAELKLALEEAQGRGEYVAVGFVDLDRFKRVNDLMGHEAGDKLLKQAAARLRKICGEFDMVARLGGDEFTAMIRRAQPEQVRKAMQQALSSLEEPFRIDGEEVLISASIGVSMFPEHGNTSQQLLRRADNAMYWAKARGKRRVHFWTPEGEDEAFGEVPEKREMGYAAEPQSALGALSRAS